MIIDSAKAKGISDPKKLVVYIVDCQNHVRNIWNKAVSNRMKKRLTDHFKEVIETFPSHLRISFELMNMHYTVDKECNGTARYAKGHGMECDRFIAERHPDVIKLPIVRTLGGARQDIEFEACLGTYYLRRYRVEWLLHALSSIEKDKDANILQQAMLISHTSREMIAQLRVGSIYYMSVIVPMRWLAGNTHLLAHRNWGVRNMAHAIDLVYNAFLKIEQRPQLMLKESFVMNIFKRLYNKLPELTDFLDYFFEEKATCVFGSHDADSRKKGIKLVREETTERHTIVASGWLGILQQH